MVNDDARLAELRKQHELLDSILNPQPASDDDPEWLAAVERTIAYDAKDELAWIPVVVGGASALNNDGFAWWAYVANLSSPVIDGVVARAVENPERAVAARRAAMDFNAAESNLHSVSERVGTVDFFWSVVASCQEYSREVLNGRNRVVVWAFMCARNFRAAPFWSRASRAAIWRLFNASIELSRARSAFGMKSSRPSLLTPDDERNFVWAVAGVVLMVALGVAKAVAP